MLKTKLSVFTLVVSAFFAQSVLAQENVNANEASYAVGVMLGKDLKETVDHVSKTPKELFVYSQKDIMQGVEDALKGSVKIDEKTLQTRIDGLNKFLMEKGKKIIAEKNKATIEEGKQFRAEFEKQDGVKKTASGLLYKIENAGEGQSPKTTDRVKVHYSGTLVDGTVFDSSYERGEPVEFQLNQLIPAWEEAIPMLKKGGKMEIVVPPELGYGERAMGNIPANATLKFKIELLDFSTPEAKK